MRNRTYVILIVMLAMLICCPAYIFAVDSGLLFDETNPYDVPALNDVLGFSETTPDTDDLIEWADRKGNEVMTLGQTIFSVVCGVSFLIGCAYLAFGVFTKNGSWGRGIVAMICAAVGFAGIVYAREILLFFTAWAGK